MLNSGLHSSRVTLLAPIRKSSWTTKLSVKGYNLSQTKQVTTNFDVQKTGLLFDFHDLSDILPLIMTSVTTWI